MVVFQFLEKLKSKMWESRFQDVSLKTNSNVFRILIALLDQLVYWAIESPY